MLGRISTVTINAPDPGAAADAYVRWLGYRLVEGRALGRDVARAWGRPGLANRESLLLEPASGADTFLRFVAGPAYDGYTPLSCYGWNAAERIVEDVDSLARRLEHSPFRIIGGPANLSFSDQIRAMQVVGPVQEVLYLTQINRRLADFDTPEPASFVDRVFIAILGGADLGAIQDYYHTRFGVARAPIIHSVVSVLSTHYDLPPERTYPIAALQVRGQCYIEADEMPDGAVARPCVPGELPPGIAVVSFEADRLPGVAASVLGPSSACAGLAYGGRCVAACVGTAGELIELIAAE